MMELVDDNIIVAIRLLLVERSAVVALDRDKPVQADVDATKRVAPSSLSAELVAGKDDVDGQVP